MTDQHEGMPPVPSNPRGACSSRVREYLPHYSGWSMLADSTQVTCTICLERLALNLDAVLREERSPLQPTGPDYVAKP